MGNVFGAGLGWKERVRWEREKSTSIIGQAVVQGNEGQA